jgi:pimeloyl-ACP methyl ester carboxylesterase
MEDLRKYGKPPYQVVVVHGGPGAPGEMAPVARQLAKNRGVLEPLQTKDSIAGQVEELKDTLQKNAEAPITLIGWSWGAWLGFILAARYPKLVRKLILVGSGPFEAKYAKEIMKLRLSRLEKAEREQLKLLFRKLEKGKGQTTTFGEIGKLIDKADSYDPLPHRSEAIKTQPKIYQSVWSEAAQLRESGRLLSLGKKIRCPVVALHGDYDPHPAKGVQKPLAKVVKDFRFVTLKKCGHHPWQERHTKEEFYKLLEEEIKDGEKKRRAPQPFSNCARPA